MDIDMHYYGTYGLARAAGLRADVALRIAIAAEFVDDSTDTEVIVNPQGARFRGESTAHHPTDFAPNNNRDDQLSVWLPFHFLPGAAGDSFSQKLICRKDSDIAREMVKHHLDLCETTFAVELMGVTAHVYADTFAHYGFSGVSSRTNRVIGESISLKNGDPLTGSFLRFAGKFGFQGGLLKNFREALDKVVDGAVAAAAADTTGALGHGAVATYPDQPYLEWSYSYERPELIAPKDVERQNANDYMAAALALYKMFRAFAGNRGDLTDAKGPLEFETIADTVRAIVTMVADRPARIAAWRKALEDGKLSREPDATLKDYSHLDWRAETNMLATLANPQDASGVPAYHFHQAAAIHKHYVLRDLLPGHGIYVI